ncbi:unnamed protein product [Closterium sp. NIES-65]|nr:unnamed protein product [Closterium sp. NIES-65]
MAIWKSTHMAGRARMAARHASPPRYLSCSVLVSLLCCLPLHGSVSLPCCPPCRLAPGLPLFLFNYSDRRLHGIFEAVSHGDLEIDPHGWTGKNGGETRFPAQVGTLPALSIHSLPKFPPPLSTSLSSLLFLQRSACRPLPGVSPGMPLFLFNFSDRRLHGVFEAVSHGDLEIDPHGWTGRNGGETRFPTQVGTLLALCWSLFPSVSLSTACFLFNYLDRRLHGIFEAVSHGDLEIDPHGWTARNGGETRFPAQVPSLLSVCWSPFPGLFLLSSGISSLLSPSSRAHLSFLASLPQPLFLPPGMPLFLFNYSDRRLHGVFEAVGHGDLEIDPHGWMGRNGGETRFPAQVGTLPALSFFLFSGPFANRKPLVAAVSPRGRLSSLVSPPYTPSPSMPPFLSNYLHRPGACKECGFVCVTTVKFRLRHKCSPLPETTYGPALSANYYSVTHFMFELGHQQTHLVKVRLHHKFSPVPESTYGPTLSANYYSPTHLFFELDHQQTQKLLALYCKHTPAAGPSRPSTSFTSSQKPTHSAVFLPLPSPSFPSLSGKGSSAPQVLPSPRDRLRPSPQLLLPHALLFRIGPPADPEAPRSLLQALPCRWPIPPQPIF